MFRLYIHRTVETNAPLDLTAEIGNDWTHFTHLHDKTISQYRLLQKHGNREVFLYKARRIWPLPFHDIYVVFREYLPEQHGYRNVYLNVRTNVAHYLNGINYGDANHSVSVSEYLFTLPDYWRLFPKLFVWVFVKRMGRIVREDNEWIEARMQHNAPPTGVACAPQIPPAFDLLDSLYPARTLPVADARFTVTAKDHFEVAPKKAVA